MATAKSNKRRLAGIVVSDLMDKTVVVQVDRAVIHSKYKKRFFASKRYNAHDEKNEFRKEDKVIIEECRPISKNKRWRVVRREKDKAITA